MFKRNDYAKQFELIVQQEVINFQKQTNNIYELIRGLTEKIQTTNEKIENTRAINTNTLIELRSHVNEQNNSINENLKRCEVNIFDNLKRIKSLRNDQSDLRSLYTEIANEKEYYTNWLASQEIKVSILSKNMEILSNEIQSKFSSTCHKSEKSIESLKNSMPNIDNLIERIETKVNLILDIYKANVDGFVKELTFMKHENMIAGKKIEHLYTQIERLK